MGIKSDKWIKHQSLNHNMINPFVDNQVRIENRQKIISYGLSSYGYDIRCANQFKLIPCWQGTFLDPKHSYEDSMTDCQGDYCIIPPNSFALTRSVECFDIPRNVLAVCVGKSTYARVGVVVNITPLEPEWSGYLTIEISNTTPYPVKIYANEGIAQLLFFESTEDCAISYRDRNGKYQGQQGIVTAKL